MIEHYGKILCSANCTNKAVYEIESKHWANKLYACKGHLSVVKNHGDKARKLLTKRKKQ